MAEYQRGSPKRAVPSRRGPANLPRARKVSPGPKAPSARPPRKSRWLLILGLGFSAFCVASLVLGSLLLAFSKFGPRRAAAPANAGKSEEPEFFAKDLTPFLDKHCMSCHSGKKPKGGLSLEGYKDEDAIMQDRAVWEKVVKNIRSGDMPPPEKPRPTNTEADRVVAWLDSRLAGGNCSGKMDPGRVTIRRLNRVEYNNTIRDLVGVNFRPADDFPADDVGYGFDNIGDVLSMPPILMEKYLAAAEKILDQAIILDPAARGAAKKFSGKNLQGKDKALANGVRPLYSEGEVSLSFDFPKNGEYAIRAKAYGDQAGPEPARMGFRLDGKEIKRVDVPAASNNPQVYEVRTKVQAGKRKVAAAFLNDFYRPEDPNPNNRDRNLYVEYIEIQGPLEAATFPDSHKRIMICQPSNKLPKKECARQIIESFATRAYRRPVKAEEVNRLVRLFELADKEGERFEKAIQTALQAVLVSPHFLFRIELDPPANADNIASINEYELATRLSYFLWSSMPDDELFAQAKQGKLRENLEPQVRRMLKDPKSKALVDNFAGQWLQTRNLKRATPDPKLFPGFDEPLRKAMLKETDLFFEEVMREDRSVLDFLDADFTFLNERLARHYGIAGIKGDEMRRVSLPGDRRGGIITQASVLTVTSNPTRTSPVKRGKWILENILGTPPPPPPPGADDLKEDDQAVASGSLRQRMEQHRKNANCAVCHQRMDTLGFGLENFDAVGAWREKDGGFTIDAAGTLPDGKSFQTPKDLRAILKGRPDEFGHCLTEKMLTYALGRGLEPYDKCTVDQIAGTLAKDKYRFSTLVVEITKSPPFQMRRGKKQIEK